MDTQAIRTVSHPGRIDAAPPQMSAERDPTGARPGAPAVLVLNHRRDDLGELVGALRAAGFEVAESTALSETESLLGGSQGGPWAVAVLNPLVVKASGVEFRLVERLQQSGPPVPVIVLVENAHDLAEAKRVDVPFHDFALKPHAATELVHRVELAVRMRERFRALHQRAQDLANQITIDFKTELLSERHFRKLLQRELKLAQRHHLPLSLLLVDVDDFKHVNDTTEYAFGDQVLKEVARVLKESVRETDFAARFGGDEFALLLPHTTPAEAVHTAMRIRKTIAGAVIESGSYKHHVTVSIGIDTYDGRSTTTPDELCRHANKALQEAKHRGKDQVWLYSERRESEGSAS